MSATETTLAARGARQEETDPALQERARQREETVSIAVTSLAAVLTAWSAFQATTWSGVQTFALARSARLRQQSTEARLEGDQLMHFDATMFIAYAGALAEHREGFASFLHDRFPPRLKTAADAWLATKPLESSSAPAHPLVMPEYKVEQFSRAEALMEEAESASVAASNANRTSDLYVLGTVLLATVILVASLGTRLRSASTRHVMLVISGAAVLALIAWLSSRPVAWVG